MVNTISQPISVAGRYGRPVIKEKVTSLEDARMELPDLPPGWYWVRPSPAILPNQQTHTITFGAWTHGSSITRTVEINLGLSSVEDIRALLQHVLQDIADDASDTNVITSKTNVLIDFYNSFE